MIRTFCRLAIALLALPALTVFVSPPAVLAQASEEQLAAASALFDAQKYAQAAKLLDAFLVANPQNPRAGAAALALGRCRTELKQYALAVPAYEKAVASKDPAVLLSAQLGLAEAALQTSQWAKAASALNAATQSTLTPEQSPIAFSWLGQADYQLGKYAAAEAAYDQVIQNYPQSDDAPDAYFGAGLAALKQGKNDDARQNLQTVVDKYAASDNHPQALLLLAQLDLDAQQYAQARDGFTAVLAAANADADTQQSAEDGLINALLKLSDYAGAATHLQTVLAKLPATSPQRFSADLTLGRCFYLQKQYAPALAAYGEAGKATDPSVASQGLYWAANSSLALGHEADAAARFREVATRFPHSDLAAKARAKVAQMQADSQQDNVAASLQQARLDLDAKKYAETVLVVTPLLNNSSVSAEAHYLMGLADQGLGKDAPAVTAFTSAVASSPNADWVPDAQTQLAWLYVGLKQPSQAEKAAAAALALTANPGYGPAIEQQARLALAQADLDQQKWDAALDDCKTLLASNPPPDVAATVGYVQAFATDKQGKPADALPLWQQLATNYPQSSYAPDALLHLGDASFAAKNYDDARAKYAGLLAKYPKSADAPQAQLGLGNALYNLSQFDAAAAAFDLLAADTTAGDLRPEALYWAGASWEKAGKKADAVLRLTQLVSKYPANAHVANAKVRLAYLKAGT